MDTGILKQDTVCEYEGCTIDYIYEVMHHEGNKIFYLCHQHFKRTLDTLLDLDVDKSIEITISLIDN